MNFIYKVWEDGIRMMEWLVKVIIVSFSLDTFSNGGGKELALAWKGM